MIIEKTMTISSAHLLLEYNGNCGRLHGHNFKIKIGIEGEADDDGMVMDFNEIKKLINRYDHVVILPTSKLVRIHRKHIFLCDGGDVVYKFPITVCVIIPYNQVTAENLALTFKQDIENYISENCLTRKVSYIEVEETENNVVRI
jgi:queuosine biosynthesis protein QueD